MLLLLRSLFFASVLISSPALFAATEIKCDLNGSAQAESGSSSGLIFETLDANDLKADSTLWEIYERSFPENERIKPENFIKYHSSQDSGTMIRLRKNEETVGFVYLIEIPAIPASFMTYLAISEKHRKHRYGSLLFHCAKKVSQDHQNKGLVWELDRPGSHDTGTYRFYEKLNSVVIQKDYFQPPLGEGESPVDMYLMFHSNGGADLNSVEFKNQIRNAIYQQCYPGYWEREGRARFN